MLLSKVITALLPIALVVLYLFTFLSSVNLHVLSTDQRNILLGDFAPLFDFLVLGSHKFYVGLMPLCAYAPTRFLACFDVFFVGRFVGEE